jgi:hypothetical protein
MKKYAFILFLVFVSLVSRAQLFDDNDSLISRDNINYNNILGTPDTSNKKRFCYLSVSINLQLLNISAWTGKAKFKGYVIQDPTKSWIKYESMNEENLEYLQTMYSLSRLFAYRLEEYMNGRYIPFLNWLEGVKTRETKDYNEKLKAEISKMEIETDFGNNKQLVEAWKNNTLLELKKYTLVK